MTSVISVAKGSVEVSPRDGRRRCQNFVPTDDKGRSDIKKGNGATENTEREEPKKKTGQLTRG